MKKMTLTVLSFLLVSSASGQTLIDLKGNEGIVEVIGQNSSERMGRAVAMGDLNSDGIDDIVLGAPSESSNLVKGRVYIFWGGEDLSPHIDLSRDDPDVEIIGIAAGDGLGSSILILDVNRDGGNDLVLGAPFTDLSDDPSVGSVHIIFGGLGFPEVVDLNERPADIVITGNVVGDNLGFSLAAGNVDDPESPVDLIVGAQGANTSGGTATGRVYVFFSLQDVEGALPVFEVPHLQVNGKTNDDRIGFAVASGDLNGDGLDDIIIGSHKRNVSLTQIDAGETYVIFGKAGLADSAIDLKDTAPDVTIAGVKRRDHLGYALSAGDVDGDGIDDLVVGARQSENGNMTNAGRVLVFYGNTTWPGTIDLSTDAPDLQILGEEISATLGSTVFTADLDGDGSVEMILGAPKGGASSRFSSGKSYIFFGGERRTGQIDLLQQSADITILGADSLDNSGGAFAAGEVDGDGIRDLLIGADNAGPAGKSYVLPAVEQITDVPARDGDDSVPSEFRLHQNYPNPFNAGTVIRFDVGDAASVLDLKIYDLLGREIKTLFRGRKSLGSYTVQWHGLDNRGQEVASGAYFAVLKTENMNQTRKLIYLK